MSKKNWEVEIAGKRHKIAMEWSAMSGGGNIRVDERVVNGWGSGIMLLPKEIRFEVAGNPAVITRKGLIFEKPRLIVDGRIID